MPLYTVIVFKWFHTIFAIFRLFWQKNIEPFFVLTQKKLGVLGLQQKLTWQNTFEEPAARNFRRIGNWLLTEAKKSEKDLLSEKKSLTKEWKKTVFFWRGGGI